MHSRTGVTIISALVLAAVALAVPGPVSAEGARRAAAPELLFSPQANQLDVYDLARRPPRYARFIPSAADGGKDLNGEVCAFPDGKHIVLGEDTDQSTGVRQGWGVFNLHNKKEVGKLIADYGPTPQPENFGCAIETKQDGSIRRIFVTQVGEGSFESEDGQLIVFFPSSPSLDAALGRAGSVCPQGDCRELTKRDSHWCVLDADIRTASGMAMDAEGNVYVAESSPHGPPTPAPGRVLRYSPPFPSSHRDCKEVEPETFIQDPLASTPGDIVPALDDRGRTTGHWYVSSIFFPSVINEYDSEGNFVRNIVPPGHGTPLGLAVDSSGTLYFADLGITFDPSRIPGDPDRLGLGPADGEGSVQRVRFSGGAPEAPEVLKDGLTFPDGLGVVSRR